MILAFDTETTGLDIFHGCRPFLITACNGIKNFYWWGRVDPWTREVSWEQEDLHEFQLLCDEAKTLVTHNGNFDIRMVNAIGIDTSTFHDKLEDTLVASHAVCSGDTHNLKDLCIKYLDIGNEDEQDLELAVKAKIKAIKRLPKHEQWCYAQHGYKHFPALTKQGTQFWKMDYWMAPEECLRYALLDAERTWKLWRLFKKEMLNYDLYKPYRSRVRLLKTAYNQQSFGRQLDIKTATGLLTKLESEIETCTHRICASAKISHKFVHDKKSHLKDLIFDRCKIPVAFWTEGKKPQPATDKNALQYYIDTYTPGPDTVPSQWDGPRKSLVDLKRLKLRDKRHRDISSLLAWCDTWGRTHSNLNVTGTRETRQSSSAPNDQNVHKQLKYLFQPPPGKVWICTDLVNIELRIWAYNVGNKELIEAFEAGRSVHFMIMELLFPKEAAIYKTIKDVAYETLSPELQRIVDQYGYIKNGNFARIYGATDKKTNETYHNGKNAPNYCSQIDSRFPGIKQFTERMVELCYVTLANEKVFAIKTMRTGQFVNQSKQIVKDLNKYQGGYRLDVPINEPFKACNYFIQGTAGQIMGEAMIDWEEHPMYSAYNCGMNSQVHDGLDTEVPIVDELQDIIDMKLKIISNAGRRYIPTCNVSYKIMYNQADKNESILAKYIK